MKGAVKRAVLLVCAVILVITSFYAYNIIFDKGRVSECEVIIGESKIFTEKEIERAAAAVKTKFRSFEGCTLSKLEYDEEYRNESVKHYMQTGGGSVNGVKEENVIIFKSSFFAENPKGDSGLTEGLEYRGWNWIVIRNSKNSRWIVKDWGY